MVVNVLKLYVIIAIYGLVLVLGTTMTSLCALPVYQNYHFTNVLTSQLNIGTIEERATAEYVNFNSQGRGLNISIAVNPLLVSLLNSFMIGANIDMFRDDFFDTFIPSIDFKYTIPIIFSSFEIFPDINLFFSSGVGLKIVKTHLKKNRWVSPALQTKYNDVKTLALGLEIYPKQLQNYKIAFYIGIKRLYSKYNNVTVLDVTYNIPFQATLVTIGCIYKTQYFIK